MTPVDFQMRRAQAADSAALARVQIDSWRSAYVGIVSDEYLAHFTYAEQAQDWREIFASNLNDVIYVAEADQVVGYAWARQGLGELPDYDAELLSMHLLPAWRRRGIGERLLSVVMSALEQRGVESLFLWTLEKNLPAHKFYEKLGGVRVGRRDAMIGDCPVVDIAYGWRDLKAHVAQGTFS